MPTTPPAPLANLGARIRQRRHELGLSQEQLAEAADLHWSYVSQCERGQRNLTVRSLLKIAGGLDTDAADLIADLEPW